MNQQNTVNPRNFQPDSTALSFIPLGGLENVTRNMYVYEYRDEILLVDCGIGFADETMLGVDLLLPDISYLLKTNKKIVGMAISHGHEDHMGALPFVLPQLPSFPIFATPFTAALANEKLKEFELQPAVQTVNFDGGEIKLGSFTISFIRVTHSVPDTAHIFIKTPAGNFYHGSDFKLDLAPADRKRSDYQKIAEVAKLGIDGLMSDCLGAEREGFTPPEDRLERNFEQEMKECQGKVIITTFASNVSRLNQVIAASEGLGRKVCFVGRSLVKAKTIAQQMGYLQMRSGTEVEVEQLKRFPDKELTLIVAGSQGQENSAMYRIAEGEFKEIKLTPQDEVIFSSDIIPGNEISVNSLIDSIEKTGAKALYSGITRNFHVSGHGSQGDLMLLLALTTPKRVVPISGNFKHMVAYKQLALKMGYNQQEILLLENGQQVLMNRKMAKLGKKYDIKNIYVDEVSGEEVESYVLRDREKLAKEGIVILMVEVNASSGQLVDIPEVIARGFSPKDSEIIMKLLKKEIRQALTSHKGRVTNWIHTRKVIGDLANKFIYKELHRRPLVLPVVIEV